MKPFTIYNEGKNQAPVIISLPHSGTWLPEEMRKSLRNEAVLANTDWFLPELYSFLAASGYTVIENQVNRYAADPNRESRMSGEDYQLPRFISEIPLASSCMMRRSRNKRSMNG